MTRRPFLRRNQKTNWQTSRNTFSKYSGNLRLDGISELSNQQIIALSKHR